MDEALKKSGEYPNIAITPGTHKHAATGEAVEIPVNARIGGESNYTRLFGTPERAARTVMRYLYDGCDGVECADGCPFYDVRYLTNCFLASNTSAHELRVWLEGDA